LYNLIMSGIMAYLATVTMLLAFSQNTSVLVEQGYDFMIHLILFVYIIILRVGAVMTTSSMLPPRLTLVTL
jgi:hypothetical protein